MATRKGIMNRWLPIAPSEDDIAAVGDLRMDASTEEVNKEGYR